MFEFTLGQGHNVKVKFAVGQKCVFCNESSMDGRMCKILTFITDMGKMFETTQGQGYKLKGQGHLCTYINMCFLLNKIIHWWKDVDNFYTYYCNL